MESYYSAHRAFAKPIELTDGSHAMLGLVRRGVQEGRWKYVRTEAHPLFDATDAQAPEIPAETLRDAFHEELYDMAGGDDYDVLVEHPEVAQRMRELLDAQLALERAARPAPPVLLDEAMRTRLEALGYAK
jgi:hypothetical protein